MADEETLKLPKPLPGSDFLTFPADRRWDLLGFVKSDEIEDIKSCEVGPDGHRYYLIHWKDSWKPESSLIYCDKLLQEFWLKKSLIQQQELLPDSSTKLMQVRVETVSSDNVKDTSMLDVGAISQSDVIIDVSANLKLASTESHIIQEVRNDVEDISENSPSVNEHSRVNLQINTEVLPSVTYDQHGENKATTIHLYDTGPDASSVRFSTSHSSTGVAQIEAHTEASSEVDNIAVETPNEEDQELEDTETEGNEHCIIDTDNTITLGGTVKNNGLHLNTSADGGSDSPSKKGAPKRKARPPRQSVTSMKENAKKNKKGKEKLKKTTKLPKISKTISTVINPDSECSSSSQTDKKTDNTPVVNNGNLKCMVCDKHLASEQSLMKHLLTHNNNHTCTVCMKTFKSTHFLKHHMDKHNSSYQYSCPVCSKKFKFKNNMRGHLRKHNMEKKFECDICHKKFIGRYNLREHMKAHSDSRPFECDFCKKAYKDRGALNKHLLTHQEKKVQCDICKRPFTNAAQVKRHMQFHYSWPGDSYKRKTNVGPNGEKLKYKCPHCEKSFNHYSNMNAHIHKKHIEKKIQCTECPKMFAYQYELREHMFIHAGGESSKFKCQFCDKSFQRSTTLKNHERTTHLGIKRFKCEVCGKLFGTKFNMKVHVEKLHSQGSSELNKTKRSRVAARIEPDTSVIPTQQDSLMDQLSTVVSLPQSIGNVGLPTHPLLRSFNTTDIIRNAMSNIPELGYFPSLQPHNTRGYQFYGMPSSDYGVS